MRINAISRGYFGLKNTVSPNFKADVIIIPSCAEPGQPERDKFIMQKQTQDYKEKLQKAFPKDDNVMIVLQPDGYLTSDKKQYRSRINEHVGYKDPERARVEILKKQSAIKEEDRLEPEIIQALEDKDPIMMKRLVENKLSSSSDFHYSEELSETIDPECIESMSECIEDLEYYVTKEQEEAPKVVEEEKEDKLFKWLGILFGDPGAPPIF